MDSSPELYCAKSNALIEINLLIKQKLPYWLTIFQNATEIHKSK